ncbi:MAG: heme o synthase [Anaerolineales bacterium]
MAGQVTVQRTIRQGEEAHAWRQRGLTGYLSLAAELFKMRIVALLLLAAFGGAFLGAQGAPGFATSLLLLATGGTAAAGASGLNQYLERESDASMPRTRNRPLVRGSIETPDLILWISLGLILGAVGIAWPFNPALAICLLFGAAIYVGVYTLWLKPRTILNIVIGGAAGSAAVMSGGAAVGAWSDPFVISLALLLFLWTPAHFWSLSLLHRSDYQQGGFPMLPAVVSPKQAAIWVLLHALGTTAAALALAVHPELGWIYLIPSAAVGFIFVRSSTSLLRSSGPETASRVFLVSNLFLVILLAALLANFLLA